MGQKRSRNKNYYKNLLFLRTCPTFVQGKSFPTICTPILISDRKSV